MGKQLHTAANQHGPHETIRGMIGGVMWNPAIRSRFGVFRMRLIESFTDEWFSGRACQFTPLWSRELPITSTIHLTGLPCFNFRLRRSGCLFEDHQRKSGPTRCSCPADEPNGGQILRLYVLMLPQICPAPTGKGHLWHILDVDAHASCPRYSRLASTRPYRSLTRDRVS